MKILLYTLMFILSGLPLPVSADPDDNDREGGILGTGIVGTITSLGSIFVNGQHIRFETGMLVTNGVTVSQAGDLRPGHTVAVVANREGEHWQATHIRQILPLVGPLQVSDDGRFNVMGTDIAARGALAAIPGDWVAVSGLWQTGQVVATRIERITGETRAQIEGSALNIDGNPRLRIGETEISGLQPRHVQEGDVIRAIGSPEASALRVTRLETGVFDNYPGVILAEGYLSPPQPSGLYTVLGVEVVAFTDNPTMIDPAVRFYACGQNGAMAATVRVSNDLNDYGPFWSDCLAPATEASPNPSE